MKCVVLFVLGALAWSLSACYFIYQADFAFVREVFGAARLTFEDSWLEYPFLILFMLWLWCGAVAHELIRSAFIYPQIAAATVFALLFTINRLRLAQQA